MERAFLVGIGGFVGSMSRYALSGWVHRLWPGAVFPGGTLSVNAIGCLLIGFLGAGADLRNLFSPEARALLFIGLLGGFTTFSSFAYETLALGRDGETIRAALNVFLNVAGCLLAAWVGSALGRGLWSAP